MGDTCTARTKLNLLCKIYTEVGIGLEHIYQPKYIAQRENIVSLGKNKRWMEGGTSSGMFLLRKYQKMGLKLIFFKIALKKRPEK